MMTNEELNTAISKTLTQLASFPSIYDSSVCSALTEHLKVLLELQRRKAAEIIAPYGENNDRRLSDAAVHHMKKQLAAIRAALNS